MDLHYLEIKYRFDKTNRFSKIKGNPEKILSEFLELLILKHNVDININNGIKIKRRSSIKERIQNILSKDILEIKTENGFLIIEKL